MPSDIDRLIAQGDLARAAALLESRGKHAQAVSLYEQLWDFAGAARAALSAGDLPVALANTLRGRDQAALARLMVELEHASAELQRQCAEVCEQRGAPMYAAQLYRLAGETARAAQLYDETGMRLEAAALFEESGNAKRAMELYRQHLEQMPDATAAQLSLGRLLVRFGQHGEAVPLLQRATTRAPVDEEADSALQAGIALVAAFSRLGFPMAAEEALRFLQRHEGAPAEVRDCLDAPQLARIDEDDDAGPVLAGRYRLGKLLGSGGMGRVYRGRDLLHERSVAVKVFTAPGGARGRDAYKRFVREAVATGQLQHPHIVSLVDFSEEMGFVVLEFMAGGSLAERLEGPMPVSTCRSVMLQVLAGLGAAHQRGIVHRDIKPSNIFFTAAGAAKLGDFGVAHLQDSGQTQTGAFIGTLAFMSPEQISGEAITFATDVYAVGVTLYLMLTGELPFKPPGLVDKHLYDKPRPPSAARPELPAICDEVVSRCLAKAPQDRYDSLSSLVAAVERFPRELATLRRGTGATSDAAGDATATAAAGTGTAAAAGDGAGAGGDNEASERFTVESTLHETPALQIMLARDDELGREVNLLRIATGPRRTPLTQLLRAAASADQHMQRVLALDPEAGHAILETLVDHGEPVELGTRRARALRVCQQLGSALGALHDAGLWHGRISADAVRQIGELTLLTLTDALLLWASATGEEPPEGSPADDVSAVLAVCELGERPEGVVDGRALARWAHEQRDAEHEREREALEAELLAEALASAPPSVRREG